MGLQVRNLWFFVAEKRLQRPNVGLLQFFVVAVCAGLPPDLLIALTVTVRSQLNIAYRCGKVIRWETGTTVHCCVWHLP